MVNSGVEPEKLRGNTLSGKNVSVDVSTLFIDSGVMCPFVSVFKYP